MWEPLGILQQRATPKGRKITLAAEKKLDGRGRENREGSQVKSSYNGIVENRGEPGLSRGSVVERYCVDSRDINDMESIEPGDQFHVNQLHLSPQGPGNVAQQLPARTTSFSHGLTI